MSIARKNRDRKRRARRRASIHAKRGSARGAARSRRTWRRELRECTREGRRCERNTAVWLSTTEWWKGCDPRYVMSIALYQPILCMPWVVYHELAEEVLGRGVWTHEFADAEAIRTEFTAKCPGWRA